MTGDFVQDVGQGGRRAPTPHLFRPVGVEDQPGDVVHPILRVPPYFVRAETAGAPNGQLREGQGMGRPPPDGSPPPPPCGGQALPCHGGGHNPGEEGNPPPGYRAPPTPTT